MYDSRHRGSNDDRKDDDPPFSRIFVVCNKDLKPDDLREHFESFGNIEDVHMPKDKHTGQGKGIAYIKYSRTSSAAAAIQQMHMKTVGNYNKPFKVMIASHRGDQDQVNEEKFTRLFIMIPKNTQESDIREHFSEFGDLRAFYMHKQGKFGYVTYNRFLETAKAFEACDPKYKAVFATPKEELKRPREQDNGSYPGRGSGGSWDHPRDFGYKEHAIREIPPGFTRVCATVTPQLPERFMISLFNVIPGMTDIDYTVDTYNGFSRAIITYEDHRYAATAVEKLHNFEFPSGEVVCVKPDNELIAKAAMELTNMVQTLQNSMNSGHSSDLVQLADAISQASSFIKAASTESRDEICSVQLPPARPLADPSSIVAKRCFIVCKPQPPPISMLKNVFSRFGDLIEAHIQANKTFGFVKYASVEAADNAIKTLHGTKVGGMYMKVMEADEKPDNDSRKRIKRNE